MLYTYSNFLLLKEIISSFFIIICQEKQLLSFHGNKQSLHTVTMTMLGPTHNDKHEVHGKLIIAFFKAFVFSK